MPRPISDRRRLWPLLAALMLAALTSLAIGGGPVGPAEAFDWLAGRGLDPHTAMVLGQLRLPRTLAALLLGAALGVAGVVLQAVTHNPLAEPGLLGVNSGAALAIALGLALAGELSLGAQLACALAGALAGSALVLLLGGSARGSPLRLVLAGLALAATCHGLMAFLLLASQANLDQFRFWLLGSLARVTPGRLLACLPPLIVGLAGAAVLARPLALLALGDDVARGLGRDPKPLRRVAVVLVGLLAGGAVALAGPIGFLGLAAPCLARGWAGVDFGCQLRFAAVFGALLTLLADLMARLVAAPFEAPVSAVLAVFGAPLLVWMVWRDAALALTRGGAEA